MNHLVALYTSGKTMRQCAALTGMTVNMVQRRLKAAGVKARSRSAPRHADRNARIYLDRRAGMTYRKLSEKYGLAASRIFDIVQAEHERQMRRAA